MVAVAGRKFLTKILMLDEGGEKMKDKKVAIFFTFVIGFTALGLSPGAAQEAIKIGSVECLTGPGSLFGLTSKQGLMMGLEDVNATGGVNGKKLEMIQYDSQTKPPIAVTVAQRLILEDKVVLISGSAASLDVLATMEVTERSNVPQLIFAAVSPLITEKGYKWVWRVNLTDKVTAQMLGKYINGKSHWKRIALLYENTDYGKPPSEVLAGIVKESKGKELVATEIFSRGDTDISGQLTKIKSQNPDLVVTWSYYTEAALIARQAQQIGLKAQLLGNQALGFPEYIQLAGPAAEGVMLIISTSSSINPNPKIQAFTKRYEEKFHRSPYINSVDCYDGAMMISEILKKVGTDPKKIQNALNTMTFQGLAEGIKFDGKGQGVKGALIAKVEGNKFKFMEYIQP